MSSLLPVIAPSLVGSGVESILVDGLVPTAPAGTFGEGTESNKSTKKKKKEEYKRMT